MKHWTWMVMMMSASWISATTRPPAVAGAFYPGTADRLRTEVEQMLGPYRTSPPHSFAALVVPHAGYVYSGPTAARAFAGLEGRELKRVLLLGPSHHAAFAGGALPGSRLTAFATPLGEVGLDREALEQLRRRPEFQGPASAHDREHCLEVELPFLQVVAPDAAVVPVLVGHSTTREQATAMARALHELLDPQTAVVVSTDFSHHGRAYGWAPFAGDRNLGTTLLELAENTAERVAEGDAWGFWQQVEVSGDTVCGKRPLEVLTELVRHGMAGGGEVLGVTTSGAVSGNWEQSVSYVAVGFDGSWKPWQGDAPAPQLGTLGEAERQAVLALARAALASHLEHGPEIAEWSAVHDTTGQMRALAGAFVTLHNTGERARTMGRLRACMGIIEAREPLLDAVIHSALSAARDPRFPPLEARELDELELEVSILSPPRPVQSVDEIQVGTHGVLLHKNGRSAVFLPQVAPEQGWDRATMLSHLARKAGLSADAWRSGARFEVFTAQVFSEGEEGNEH